MIKNPREAYNKSVQRMRARARSWMIDDFEDDYESEAERERERFYYYDN